jgi:hypothetical protein
MEKLIELTPEWILDKLTVTHYADGKGKVTICADTVSDSRWIDLALDTLGVKYKTFCVGYDPDPEKQYFEVQWKFKLDAIKAECPNLYNKLKTIDDANAHRLLVAQQLIDNRSKKK